MYRLKKQLAHKKKSLSATEIYETLKYNCSLKTYSSWYSLSNSSSSGSTSPGGKAINSSKLKF